jgi:hypothetical protein
MSRWQEADRDACHLSQELEARRNHCAVYIPKQIEAGAWNYAVSISSRPASSGRIGSGIAAASDEPGELQLGEVESAGLASCYVIAISRARPLPNLRP